MSPPAQITASSPRRNRSEVARRIDAEAQAAEDARAAEEEARLRRHAPHGLWFGDHPADEIPW